MLTITMITNPGSEILLGGLHSGTLYNLYFTPTLHHLSSLPSLLSLLHSPQLYQRHRPPPSLYVAQGEIRP